MIEKTREINGSGRDSAIRLVDSTPIKAGLEDAMSTLTNVERYVETMSDAARSTSSSLFAGADAGVEAFTAETKEIIAETNEVSRRLESVQNSVDSNDLASTL